MTSTAAFSHRPPERALRWAAAGPQEAWVTLDVMVGVDPGDWPRFDLERLERHVQATLARAA